MCTYNGERFLKEQIDSILQQTCPPDEIIICDDCSGDHTAQIARSILAKWTGAWQVIENESNLGFRKNFEKVIQLCHGDIIFLSDQDDVWELRKIEKMMQVFQKYPNIILAFHDAELVDENLNRLTPSFWQTLDFEPSRFVQKDYRQLLGHNVVQGSACAFRRKLVAQACPFPRGAVHDEWLALSALSLGEIFPLCEVLLKYRQWGSNALGGGTLSIKEKLQKWIFSTHNAVRIHQEYIEYKHEIDEIWAQTYGGTIKKQSLMMFSCHCAMQKRYEYVQQKSLKFFTLLPSYFPVYPMKLRRVKEIIKDLFSVLI